MGGSLKWMKSLVAMKKHEREEHLTKNGAGRSRKWKFWRSSSMSESIRCDENKAAADHFSAIVDAIVRAPLKDFQALRKQWAAIRIQTFFRGFLARRALRALKAVVRIQAIFRGQQVRKQAAQTLQCMESLIRAQIRVRSQRLKVATEEQGKQSMPAAMEELSLENHHDLNNCNDGCNCLERYMAARMSERYCNKHGKKVNVVEARYSNQGHRKNITKDKDSAKVQLDQKSKQYFRESTSEFGYNKNSESSPIWTPSSESSSTLLASEETEVSGNNQPNYMNLTESIKAKHMSRYAQRMTRSCREQHCRRAALSDIESDWRIQSALWKEKRSSVKGLEKENVYYY